MSVVRIRVHDNAVRLIVTPSSAKYSTAGIHVRANVSNAVKDGDVCTIYVCK